MGTPAALARLVTLAILCLSLFSSAARAQPPAPTLLNGSTGHAEVQLLWDRISTATSYNLYRGTTPGGQGATPIETGILPNFYTDTNITNGLTYYYKLTAVNANGESPFSAEVVGFPNVRVNAGGIRYQSGNITYAADTGSTGGGAFIQTTTTIGGTSEQPVFQKQRAGASTLSYSLPTADGAYVVTLLFAEIQGASVGANTFKIIVNGQTVDNAFDIRAFADPYTALRRTFYTTVTGGNLTLQFVPVTGSAAIAGFYLERPPAASASDVPPPGYAMDALAADSGTDADGAGPGSSIRVNLASLAAENAPGTDISAYNPVGPGVSYGRLYRSPQVTHPTHQSSPGLSAGWTDNYDLQMTTASATAWSAITLRYGNNATEVITPTVTGGVATFTHPAGAPYVVSGVPSGTVGQWTSLTLTFKDRSKHTFLPPTGATGTNQLYLFRQITNLVGHYVTINRDTSANGYRVQSIVNDAGTTLLQFNYSGANLLSIQDISAQAPFTGDQRQVNYAFSGGFLSTVSQIGAIDSAPPAQWQYGYQLIGAASYLNTVKTPNAANNGSLSPAATGYYFYDVSALTRQTKDAVGRLRDYLPQSETAALVNVHNPDLTVAQSWVQQIGVTKNLNTGFKDAKSNTFGVAYDDANNPYLPTSATNRNYQQSDLTYDQYGNVLTATSPRGVRVTNVYDYSFPLGQVQTTQLTHLTSPVGGSVDATRIPTTITYYTSGLVQTVTSPKPGTSYPTAPSVVTTYTYTPLGNVATITGPNANGPNGLVTFNYGATEKLGQPLTVIVSGLDAGGATTTQTTTYTYDGRGNVLTVTDASGNVTTMTYNPANQLVTVQQPATGETGPATGHVTTTNVYQYYGGPVASVTLSNESGVPVRQVNYTYSAEGEVASVTGSTQPATYAYDGRGRVTSVKDGNGRFTYYLYDNVGNLLQLQYPLSGGNGLAPLPAGTIDTLTNLTFDSEQNVLTTRDGRGVVTTYTRVDPESQVTGVAYSNLPAWVSMTPPVAYGFDVWGRLSARNDGVTGNAATPKTYVYDDLDNPLSITTNFVNGPQSQTITYSYNPDGSRYQMGSPVGTYGYQYDGLGRETKATFPWLSGSATYVYEPNGWIQSAKTPRFLTTYTYNARGLVTRLLNQNILAPVTNISDFTGMTYDAAGNRFGLSASIPANGSAPAATRTQTFAYDTNYPGSPSSARDVMLKETSASGGNSYGQQYVWYFGFDAAYNASTMRSATIAHNANNQRTTPGNLGGFSYDGNGNPTKYNSAAAGNFAFDVENRLTSITTPAFSASYGADGLRAKRTTSGNGTLYFLYDEAGASQTPLLEITSGGTVAAATGMGADGVRSRYYTGIGSNFYNGWFYVYDPQGNTVQRTTDRWNADTGLLFYDTSLYDAYGFLLRAAWTGGTNNPHRDPVGFGGQHGYYTDFETGLLCLTHRYYDPATGRFVNRDPIGYDGGMNLYSFAGGNPVNEIDPDGLRPPTQDEMDATFDLALVAQGDTLQYLFGGGGVPDYGMGDDSANAAFLNAVSIANSSSFGMGGKRGSGSRSVGLPKVAAKGTKAGTYILRDSNGVVRRTGMASNLSNRKSDHKKDFPHLAFEVDRYSDDREARRGREQIIHDRYHGTAHITNGGYNKDNPISPRNNTPEMIKRMIDKGKKL